MKAGRAILAAALVAATAAPALAREDYEFSGFYFGTQFGRGWGNIDATASTGLAPVAGGYVGYAFESAPVVLAIEAEAMWSARSMPDWSIDWTAGVRTIWGITFGNILIHSGIGAGYAPITFMGTTYPEIGISFSAGMTWHATEHLVGRIEYHRVSFGTLGGTAVPATSQEVRGGFAWQFGN